MVGESSDLHRRTVDDSRVMEMAGKIMVVAIVALFVVAVLFFFRHVYAKWFCSQRPHTGRRFDFAPGSSATTTTVVVVGLDLSVLKSIPVIVFDPKDFKEELECAVCLSELGEGERARLLPKCNHGFHVDCIDMWFQSHSTCPLCRNPVSPQSTSTTNIHPPPSPPSSSSSLAVAVDVDVDVDVSGYSTECPNFPTNVLFWGGNNQTEMTTLGSCLPEEDNIHRAQGSSSSIDSSQLSTPSCTPSSSSTTTASSSGPEGEMVVIDIPTQTNDQEEEEEEEEDNDVKKLAVAAAVTRRMRSLKRLLSYKDGSF